MTHARRNLKEVKHYLPHGDLLKTNYTDFFSIKSLKSAIRWFLGRPFDPKKTFFQLWPVWLYAISIFSFVLVTIITLEQEYTFELCNSHNCFNSFLDNFKFQIGTLASLIPVFALFAAQHRSSISVEQIKQAEAQNNFANYYKHLEEFEKYIKAHESLQWIGNSRRIHTVIYPNAANGEFNPDWNFLAKLSASIEYSSTMSTPVEESIQTSAKTLSDLIFADYHLIIFRFPEFVEHFFSVMMNEDNSLQNLLTNKPERLFRHIYKEGKLVELFTSFFEHIETLTDFSNMFQNEKGYVYLKRQIEYEFGKKEITE